jgi:hypothetical protein
MMVEAERSDAPSAAKRRDTNLIFWGIKGVKNGLKKQAWIIQTGVLSQCPENAKGNHGIALAGFGNP